MLEQSAEVCVPQESHLSKLVGYQPGDLLAKHFYLVVEALDADKDLAQGMCAHNVGLPLQRQAASCLHRLGRDGVHLLSWQPREEVQQGEGIVQVAQCIQEGRVPVAQ